MENTIYIIENEGRFGSVTQHFESLKYIIKAKSVDDTRKNIMCIHVEDGIYYGTDGCRLHVYSPEYDELPVRYLIPDGDYEVLTNNAKHIILRSVDVTYPDVWRVLNYRRYNGIDKFVAVNDKKRNNYDVFVYHLLTGTKQCFNLGNIKDAMFTGEITFDRTKEDKNWMHPIVFGNEKQFAMIMPLKPN
jgi:hypothetical protein